MPVKPASKCYKGRKGSHAKPGNKDTCYEERKVAEWQARLDEKRQRSKSAQPAHRSPQTVARVVDG